MALNTRKNRIIAFVLMDIAIASVLISMYFGGDFKQSEQLAQPPQNDSSADILKDSLRELGVSIYPEPRKILPFELVDQTGELFSQEDLLGQWSLVFFGFSSCPDICPLTLAELKLFYLNLESSPNFADTKVIMVTVDPSRDDSDTLATYLESFHADFMGLTGTHRTLSTLAQQLYFTYSQREYAQTDHTDTAADSPTHEQHSPSLEDYTISHSPHIAVINPEGEYHSVIRAPHRHRILTQAYEAIRSH